jgi:hypothetical protein
MLIQSKLISMHAYNSSDYAPFTKGTAGKDLVTSPFLSPAANTGLIGRHSCGCGCGCGGAQVTPAGSHLNNQVRR